MSQEIFSSVYFLWFAYFVAGGFALSGLDDLFFDLVYLGWRIKRLFNSNRIRNFTVHMLEPHAECPVAIFVPCWKESQVIGKMVRLALNSIKYTNYIIVLGIYPNDKPTLKTARRLARQYPNKVKISINTKPGPTTKADNLNAMLAHLDSVEGRGKEHAIVVLHDSEDIIHPYSLRVYNYLICKLGKDMVQIPVLPLTVPVWEWVHWTYADEFAENHLRQLVTRERLGSFVPSAGVGTAYRRASLKLLEQHHQRVFNPESLVEDYHSAIELHHRGHGTIFATLRTDDGDPVATRSIFPRQFKTAVRQKTRWITGIALQSWKHHGWKGRASTKYCLFKDRKQLITGSLNFFGYIILVPFFIMPVFFGVNPIPHIPPVLWTLFLFDTFLFFLRVLLRMSAVVHFYDIGPALLVPIRYVIANFINFFATVRALWFFFVKSKNQPLKWDKTAHEFTKK